MKEGTQVGAPTPLQRCGLLPPLEHLRSRSPRRSGTGDDVRFGWQHLTLPGRQYYQPSPITPGETEALYRVHVVGSLQDVWRVRDLLFEELEHHHYPIRDFETLSDTEEVVELAADLLPTSADPAELDAIVEHLERNSAVASATWTVSTIN